MKNLVLAAIAIISMGLSCSKSGTETGKDVEADCPEDVMCTEEFRSIMVEVKNKKGESYELDSYQTIKLPEGEKLILDSDIGQDSVFRANGQYPVLTDGERKLVRQKGTEIQFTGSRNGKEVVKQTFIIGHDCCHIILMSGDTKIVIPE